MNNGYSSSLSDPPDNIHPRDCNCDDCNDKRRTAEQAEYLARGKYILEQCLERKRAREEAELSKPKQEEKSNRGKVEGWKYGIGLIAMLVGTAFTSSILPFVVFVLFFTYLEYMAEMKSDRQ